MLVAIADIRSDLASSDDGEDGEDQDANETGKGNLRKDDEPGWVMGTITITVQQCMERFRQKQMMLDELTQPGWEDAAGFFGERVKMYGTSELRVPPIAQPQTNEDTPAPPLTMYG
jgi:hypothetical protein